MQEGCSSQTQVNEILNDRESADGYLQSIELAREALREESKDIDTDPSKLNVRNIFIVTVTIQVDVKLCIRKYNFDEILKAKHFVRQLDDFDDIVNLPQFKGFGHCDPAAFALFQQKHPGTGPVHRLLLKQYIRKDLLLWQIGKSTIETLNYSIE